MRIRLYGTTREKKSGDLGRIVSSKKINNEIVVFSMFALAHPLISQRCENYLKWQKQRKLVIAFFNTMNTISNKLNLALSGLNLWPQKHLFIIMTRLDCCENAIFTTY